MPYIHLTKSRKLILAGFSIAIWVLSFTTYAIITSLTPEDIFYYVPRAGIYFPTSEKFNIGVLIATILALLPVAIINYFNDKYVDEIERTLPDVFKALAESIQAGLSLPHAVKETSVRGYGVLGKLLKAIATRTALGLSFESAVDAVLGRYEIPSLKRSAKILKIAYESGGRTFEVLDTAAKVYGLLWSYTYERRTSVRQYVLTIYASLLIFLVIGVVLIEVFFIPLATLQKSQPIHIFRGLMEIPVYKAIILYTAFIEAIFGGLIAGKMIRGSVKSGALHVILQLVMVLVFFLFVIPAIEGTGLFSGT